MKSLKFVFAFIYLTFTALVNVQGFDSCTKVKVAKHECCCSASSGCNEDMSCCVGENEDDSPNYAHALNAPLEIQKLIILETETNFKNEEKLVQLVDVALKSNPPPRLKVYLAIHKLIYYA